MVKTTKKRVLFISHDASRTGAPMLLLVFLQWLKANSDLEFTVLLGRGGALVSAFQALAPTLVVSGGERPSLLRRLLRKLQGRRLAARRLRNLVDLKSLSLIYANTAANGHLLAQLSGFGIPVVTHVHELEIALLRFAGATLPDVLACTDHYIACAAAVKRNLVTRHGIADSQVTVIHGFSQYAMASCVLRPPAASRPNMARQLGVDSYDFLVGACGTTDWRKGVDIFIQLASRMVRKLGRVGVHFVWIGERGDALGWRQLQYDLTNAELLGWVHFIGEVDSPWEWLCALDVFVLPSREDPFPLVCLEAASAAVPIVCFDRAGGEPEFVETDCGFVVPYLDVEEMTDRVEELLCNDGLRRTLGENAVRKVRERHSVDVIGQKLLDCMLERMP